jgi:hypothetical protein
MRGPCAPRAGKPQTDEMLERLQETILEERWKPALPRSLIPNERALRLDLDWS